MHADERPQATAQIMRFGCLLAVLIGLHGTSAIQSAAQPVLDISVREIWTTSGYPGFGMIGGMAQWPDGAVWIGDRRLAEVSEVSPDGSDVRVVLRKGEGPGEVDRVHRIEMLPDGGAVVLTGTHYELFRADKKFDRRQPSLSRVWIRGFLVTPDGGFLLSGGYGYSEEAELASYAIHRYDESERHLASWHPVTAHDDWEVVRSTSGGAVALTRDGGLLVSDAAPFRITKYSDLDGNGAQAIVEDESLLASREVERAVQRAAANTVRYSDAWNKSFFVSELDNGNILNVIVEFPDDPDDPQTSLWIVVTPAGKIAGQIRLPKGYRIWNATPDGHYLASYWDNDSLQHLAAKLEVAIKAR